MALTEIFCPVRSSHVRSFADPIFFLLRPRRNYYDTLVKVFGKDGISSQFQAVVKTLPESKRKLLQDVYKGLNQ